MKTLLITCIVALALLSTANALAQGGTAGPLTWNFEDGTLTISGEGAMPDYYYPDVAPWDEYREAIHIIIMENGVTNIGSGAFVHCSNLISITIPDGVTSIGNSAFFGCTSLPSITIPDSVTAIGDGAFYYCESLTSIIIPNGVTKIGKSVFAYCERLISIIIPNGVTSIENGAFFRCISLTSITIPNSVTTIEHSVFFYCESLTSITIPDGVTSVEKNTFALCTSLVSITFSNNITSIENNAFTNCRSLTSIIIPNSVTNIGDYAFVDCGINSITIPSNVANIGVGVFHSCKSLTSIEVEDENNTYVSENGVLFDKNKTTLICCPAGKTGTYIIPNSVTNIEEDAFRLCQNLTSVTIPNNVISIGDRAFSYCTSLTSITNLNSIPIYLSPDVFYKVNQGACALEVPAASVPDYKNAAVWKNFKIVGIGEGIEETDNYLSLQIYPNPASGTVTITAPAEIEQLHIFDITGRFVNCQTPANRQVVFDTGVLPKGIYLVQARLKGGRVQTGKIVVSD